MHIRSLLDTDYYKFTQGQFILHQFPTVITKHIFINRNKDQDFTPYIKEIEDTIDQLCDLKFYESDILFLKSQWIFKESYLDFLRLFKFNKNHIVIKNEDELKIEITGPFYLTIYFEQILSLISEIYNTNIYKWNKLYDMSGRKKLKNKINMIKDLKGFQFADFGTRRRCNYFWHNYVIKTLSKELDSNTFIGTSNVYFAKEYDLKPIGTQAHEIYMMAQQLTLLEKSQTYILNKWRNEYGNNLRIALTDTIGIDAFLKDFDIYFSNRYTGVRHDSGCPFDFAEKIINHYKKFRIDPLTKTIVFSDGLNFKKAIDLFDMYKDKINVFLCIGTNLTNDFERIKPLSIVMKMQQCNGDPVAKISDEPGKTQCEDEEYLNILKETFKRRK